MALPQQTPGAGGARDGEQAWHRDIGRLFEEPEVPPLEAERLPDLAAAVAAALQIDRDLLPEGRIRDVLVRATDRARDRLGTPAGRAGLAAINAARAFLLLDGPPFEEVRARIGVANGDENLSWDYKPFRWSYARYEQLRTEQGAEPETGFQAKAGSRRKDRYVAALTEAVEMVFRNRRMLADLPTTPSSDDSRSPRVSTLLAEGERLASQLRVGPALYVTRTVEESLFGALVDPAHSWCHAVVGDAGFGKSTLLVSLADRIGSETRLTPVLLSAAWFQAEDDRLNPAELLHALDDLLAYGEQPVVLLDTADLLLHDERSLGVVRDLLSRLQERQITVGITSRPREAELLSHGEIRRIVLGPYDDQELVEAVTSLAAARTRKDAQAASIRDILSATARGLPAAEICRSPLLLRVLFDLAGDQAPELREIDVTRLFEDYWQRRIIRDARTDTATGFDIEPDRDLTDPAGTTALAMLAAGTPELDTVTLTSLAERIQDTRPGASPPSLRRAIDTLVQRGVLLRSGDRVRFFHQTMFEFAAAKALARHPGPSAVPALLARVIGEGGDLFVGAVLEQLLLILGPDPTAEHTLRDAVATLLHGPEPLQDIALIAWAHHPHLVPDPAAELSEVKPSAVTRAAIVVPTVAGVPAAPACTQLEELWLHGREEARVAIVQAFARLARRAPADVARAVDRVRLVATMTAEEGMIANEIAAVSDLLLAIAVADPASARKGLTSLVRACARLGDQHVVLAGLLGRIAGGWEALGGDLPYLLALLDILVPLPESTQLVDGVARMIAAARMPILQSGADEGVAAWKATISAALAPDDGDPMLLAKANVVALGYLLSEFGTRELTVGPLRQIRESRDGVVARIADELVLPRLLAGGSVASDELAQQIRDDLDLVAPGGSILLAAERSLAVLASPAVPAARLAALLPSHWPERFWMAHPALIGLVPAAAAAGNGPTQRVVRDLPKRESEIPEPDRQRLRAAALRHVTTYPPLVDLVVALDISLGDAVGTRLIARSGALRARLVSLHPQLLEHARALMSDPAKQPDGAALLDLITARQDAPIIDWAELRSYLEHAVDPAVRRVLVGCIWKLPTTPATLSAEVDYLHRSLDVTPSAVPPVTRRRGGPDTDPMVLEAIRHAWLRLLTLEAQSTVDGWPTVKALSLYTVDSSQPSLDGRDFALATQYLANLATVDLPTARTLLIDYLTDLSSAEFESREVLLWRRELHKAIRPHLDGTDDGAVAELVAATPRLAPVIAGQLLDLIAELRYEPARPRLQRLLDTDLDTDLRSTIVGILRSRDRSFGTRAYLEVLDIAARRPGTK